MISFEKFKLFLETQLLGPLRLESWGFIPHFSTSLENFLVTTSVSKFAPTDFMSNNGFCVWWHEEPIYYKDFSAIFFENYLHYHKFSYFANWVFNDVHFPILANSEKSSTKKKILKESNFYDWYFFLHGFAALDWFSDYKYFDFYETKFDKVFISLNNNLIGKRSYRLALLSLLVENNLDNFGHISYPQLSKELIKNEIFSPNSELSTENKKLIFSNLWNLNSKKLDDCDYNYASAEVGDTINTYSQSNFHRKALFHIVNETNFYDDKLHLTEKIFKPIVVKRPFILVASIGNLEYLKQYGFKTFDKWIDESYDNEPDNNLRLIKIINEIKKLCQLSKEDLLAMYVEMQDILNYNHNHFYTKFKKIIVNELVDNFEICCKQYNLGRSTRFRLPTENIDLEKIKNIMLS